MEFLQWAWESPGDYIKIGTIILGVIIFGLLFIGGNPMAAGGWSLVIFPLFVLLWPLGLVVFGLMLMVAIAMDG